VNRPIIPADRAMSGVPAAKAPLVERAFIGDGPLLDDCRALAKLLGVADKIRFHGIQPPETVRQVMGQASMFL
jgi:colanic acid/amylovoran biosynthesis glycosyltransferase